METISLKEASELVGRDQSTIRKTFQKPTYKEFTTIVRGKIFIDKNKLLEVYPRENGQTRQYTEVGGIGRNVPNDAELSTNKEDVQQSAIDAAMQALISQLEAKDNQIDSLLQRIQEANINHSRLLQQNNPQQPVDQSAPVQDEVKETSKSWKVTAIVALVVLAVCAMALGVALVKGYRFMQ